MSGNERVLAQKGSKLHTIVNCYCFVLRTFSEISSPDQLMQKCHDLCSCLAEDVAQERLKVCEVYGCGRHQQLLHC